MARTSWIAHRTVVLGLSACCSAGCAAELPDAPNDYEIVEPKKKDGTKASEGEDESEAAAASRSASNSSTDEDRTGPARGVEPVANEDRPIRENTVLLDGKPMTISTAEAHVNRYGAFFTVNFTGENAPPKTQIILNFQSTGSGCVSGAKAQELFLYPGGSSSNAYRSIAGPACGLEIAAFPTNVGDVAAGTFKGTLEGLNGVAGKTRTLEMTFEVKSIAQP